MRGLLIRWVFLTMAIMVTSYLLPGIEVSNIFSAFIAAAVLGILNALLRPILIIMTLPINIVTIGLFTLIINAGMLKLTASLIYGFDVHGFWTAVFGALIISIVSWLLNGLISEKGRVDIIDLKKRGDGRWA
jgi:putative membrane protein